jgi:uncharacterized protein YqgC (DUF456 family)
VELLVVAAIVVGLVGVVVPVLPGLLLVAGAIGLWAAAEQVWWLLAAVVVLGALALALKVAIPARTARDSASMWAVAVGAVGALIGFFAIPVLGMIVGFLAGVLLAELVRLRALRPAWDATWTTTKGIGASIAVELAAVIVMAGLWATALVLE